MVANPIWLTLQSRRIAMVFLAVLIFTPRLLNLDAFLNVDGCAFWLDRSLKFYKALYQLDPSATLLAGHPGVTLLILSGGGIILGGLLKYGTLSFWSQKGSLVFFAKLPIVIVTGTGILFLYAILRKNYNETFFPLTAAFLVSIDPFFLAHTRYFGTDGLAAIFMLLALVLGIVYLKNLEFRHLFGSAIFTALSLLTKSYAISLIPFIIAIIGIAHYKRNEKLVNISSSVIKAALIWVGVTALIFFILWPAMWVSPIKSIKKIYKYGEVAVIRTHENIGDLASGKVGTVDIRYKIGLKFDGRTVRSFFERNSIFILIMGFFSIIIAFTKIKKHGFDDTTVLSLLCAAFLIYFLAGMSFAGKTDIRYCVIAFLLLDIMAAYTVANILLYIKEIEWKSDWVRYALPLVMAACLFMYAFNVFTLHPYYQTFHNKLSSPKNIGWGEGLEQVAAYLNKLPNNKRIVTASFYPCVLDRLLDGKVVDLDRIEAAKPDYIVLYQSQVARYLYPAIVDEYYLNGKIKPEFIVKINGIEYAWVYKNEKSASYSPK